MIDITITATLRPNIFEKTLQSFFKNMLNDIDCRLILNVDPIGDNDIIQKDILHIAQKFPFKEFLVNFPKEPSFTKAVMWCWNNLKYDYVLHLEDDWELLRKVCPDNMIKILKNNPYICSLKLSKENIESDNLNNGFIDEDKLSLNPSLIKTEFLKDIVNRMSIEKNPEKQIRKNNGRMISCLANWKYGIYTSSGYEKIVCDLGRIWMEKTKYSKPIGFMNWEKNELS